MLTEIRSLDWRNVGHLCTNRGRNETMIAKGTVCRIDSNPSSSRQKNLNPCMQVALSPPILNVNMKVAEETAHHSDPQTDFPENRGAEQCGIPTGAGPQFDGLGWQPGFSFDPYFVRNFRVQRRSELDQRVNGVSLSVQLPDFFCTGFFLRINDPERTEYPLLIGSVLKRKLKRSRGEQEMKRVLRQEFKF